MFRTSTWEVSERCLGGLAHQSRHVATGLLLRCVFRLRFIASDSSE